jgi:hypothetical protein
LLIINVLSVSWCCKERKKEETKRAYRQPLHPSKVCSLGFSFIFLSSVNSLVLGSLSPTKVLGCF